MSQRQSVSRIHSLFGLIVEARDLGIHFLQVLCDKIRLLWQELFVDRSFLRPEGLIQAAQSTVSVSCVVP